MDRRSAIKLMSIGGVGAFVCDIPGTSATSGGYVAAFDFAESSFTGTITEPDGTVNNLSGYHGTGTLPPLGGVECPPVASAADVVLSGVVEYPQGFTVPAGQVWELDPNVNTTVTVGGNIVVNGTLRARPSSTVTHRIRFAGINEANIVGGMVMAPLASDVGLWVDGGVLDISGTRKVAWNRNGTDPTWLPTDQLLAAPTAPGDYVTRPHVGQVANVSTPTLYAGTTHQITRTYQGEVFNMTRNMIIESISGRAHIMFINVTQPQSLEYTELVRLGPTGKLGRYPLHVHMNGDGTDGSLFRGNVAKNCGNHAFVPHASNGCDMSFSIAYRTTGDAFWWDLDNETERISWDRCAAIETKDGSGFVLGEGVGMSCVSSVAVGTVANSSAAGFMWASQANGDRNVWLVEDSVAHNNNTHGFRVWQNDSTPHAISRCVAYRNALEGFSHGAYINRYRYFQCVAFGNVTGDMVAHALGSWSALNCWVGVFRLTRHSQPATGVNLIESSRDWPVQSIQISEGASGGPANGGLFRFVSSHFRSDILPANVTVTGLHLSTIEVVNNKAPSFTLRP